MTASILDLCRKRVVLLDGGMGSELIKQGLPQGTCPEQWNNIYPDRVKNIHTDYFEAGSDAVLTNSFGGNAVKLSSYSLEERCYSINRKAAELAKEVCPDNGLVGGSMGPTGKFLKPYGEFNPDQFEDAYAEQARGLNEGGADFLLIETQYDLREALCALRGARRHFNKDIYLTLTFNQTPRGFFTMMGNSLEECSRVLEENEVPAYGANCTLESKGMASLIKEWRVYASSPLIAQANAGQPVPREDGTVYYKQSPEDYVRYVPPMIENGADIIGGCCGTDPEFIRKMAEIIKR
jgi:5-methyltetrahydrofolate--homocysteine methyltransferase